MASELPMTIRGGPDNAIAMTITDLKAAAGQYAKEEAQRWSFTEGQYQELIMFLDWLDARLKGTDTYKAAPGGW